VKEANFSFFYQNISAFRKGGLCAIEVNPKEVGRAKRGFARAKLLKGMESIMEWERAKTYLLIFFLLLNAGLGLLLFAEDRRYTLTFEQERRIRTILDQNNVILYELPMRRFPPMQPLSVTGFYYDRDELIRILFEDPLTVERRRTFEGYIFQDASRQMIISSGFVFFEDPNGFRQWGGFQPTLALGEITDASVISLTTGFINSYFPDFVQDGDPFVSEDDNGGVRIIYRQEYRGTLVHSNFIEFLVTSVGIYQMEMQFGRVIGHSGTPTMIFSPDEVLLTFVQRVGHIAQENPMSIRDMDLVYFQEYISDQGGPYNAVPFYRIFTHQNERPFLINAFTNVIID